MTARPLAPVNLLSAVAAVALLMAAFVIIQAYRPPLLGLTLAADPGGAIHAIRTSGPAAAVPAGTRIVALSSARDRIVLKAQDLVIEPAGGVPTYRELDRFHARQTRIAAIQRSPSLVLEDARGTRWIVHPLPHRPLTSLPAEFWVQLFVGLFAWLIAGCIWAFRSGETSARYLLLSGASTLTFAPLAAIYSTRELALPGPLFRAINDLNFLGGTIFAATLAAILLYYPRRIAPRWIGQAVVAFSFGWWVAQEIDLFQNVAIARRLLVMVELLATFVLSFLQWRLTRRDPLARASLQWFLMSWLIGAGLFCGLILFPQLFGVDTSAFQGYGFTLFLLVYGGLALGIIRFRLFDLGLWWTRMLTWTASVLALVALDLIFAFGLGLSASFSLALALLLCGLIWLPLRGFLWGRFMPTARDREPALFRTVAGIGLASSTQERAERWEALLRDTFDPLTIEQASAAARAELEEDGLALLVPDVHGTPAFRLHYARGGRRLFTRADTGLANELAGMLGYVIEGRRAQQQAAAGERERIASDLHDNIGARLLTALHLGSKAEKDDAIRDTLADLRSIVSDAAQSEGPIGLVLANLRRETAERLAGRGVALDWQADDADDLAVAEPLATTLRAVVREATSNMLKHAGATRATIRLERSAASLTLTVADDGDGTTDGAASDGRGLAIMRRRVETLGGTMAWTSPKGDGTTLCVTLPLDGREAGS